MIPRKLLSAILKDPYYDKCVRLKEGACDGRVTLEHCFIYAGRQIQEHWAIIPLCEFHHDVLSHQDGGDLRKDLNQYFSLKRATEMDLKKYPRTNWIQLKKYLFSKYEGY